MKLTILGSGNAGGVPAYGCDCPACRRALAQPSYRRAACSALLETADGRLLVDAGLPDLKERFPAGSLSHILLTHYHMDHVHGLFPMRWGRAPLIEVISPDDPAGCDDLYKHPGILDFSRKAAHGQGFSLLGVEILPLRLNHSRPTLGYRFGPADNSLAYLTDTCGLPDETLSLLQQAPPRVMIIDCSYPPHSGCAGQHNALNDALASHAQVRPQQTLLTHIGHELDCWLMENDTLPDGVQVARDGMTVAL
jgi:phosphoribosyl 1,2-cyclic phosphate phosphodiesterase